MNMFDFRTSCEQIETFIFNNELSFLQKFLPTWDAELIRVSFSSNRIYFTAVLESGQHIVYDISWIEFNDWKNNNMPQ